MKVKNRIITLCSSLLCSLPIIIVSSFTVAVADDDSSRQAQQLINEMFSASRELNYDGIFVYRRGNRIDAMRLIHKADANGERERMVSLTGYAREVIRDGKSVTCIFPDNQAVMVEKSRPQKLLTAQLPEPIEKIANYYEFSVTGRDRVAGRATWVVNIVPKDGYRYGYQLWIDEDTKLLLKSELKDDSGWPVEQILFTQLDVVEDIPDQLLEPAISGSGYTRYVGTSDDIPVHAGDGEWRVTWMPAGFEMSDHEKQAMVANDMPVDHMVYTDGLAIVSVFVEKLENDPDAMQGPSRMGGVNAFATLSNGYQVTAVGEVPQKTVQLMANSVVQGR